MKRPPLFLCPFDEIAAGQKELNELLDNFIKKYGLISSRANVSVFSKDGSMPLSAVAKDCPACREKVRKEQSNENTRRRKTEKQIAI